MRLIPARAGKTFTALEKIAFTPAHPRSRGENGGGHLVDGRPPGSSPLARGKHDTQYRTVARVGLIPARAGKTRWRRPTSSPRRAHPRSRGENAASSRSSSPTHWLIPARAGKTRLPSLEISIAWAHPRSRGENLSNLGSVLSTSGSSPLARGKHDSARAADDTSRLIPARAGKTPRTRRQSPPPPAHPRSRGENHFRERIRGRRRGSSPLARGKQAQLGTPVDGIRLIPARAGKTARAFPTCSRARAHPRSRGENFCTSYARSGQTGSSPLARGKRTPWGALLVRRGLIPARAGKTRTSTALTRRARAHPRSRGENKIGWQTHLVGVGSSPLARGKR